MADYQNLRDDIRELAGRIATNGLVSMTHSAPPTFRAVVHIIPTLAERGAVKEATLLTGLLADQRDENGGWDTPWMTVYAIEALVGLALRGIMLEDPSVLDHAVRYLRGASSLSPVDRELRLSRALVLAGVAKKDAMLIDAGMLRARSVAEKGLSEDRPLTDVLHGLLALTDLYAISNDAATSEIIKEQIAKFKIDSPEAWADDEENEVISRAGTILAKMSYKDAAIKAYDLAHKKSSHELDTVTLKHRIELGARLYGEHPDTKFPMHGVSLSLSPNEMSELDRDDFESHDSQLPPGTDYPYRFFKRRRTGICP